MPYPLYGAGIQSHMTVAPINCKIVNNSKLQHLNEIVVTWVHDVPDIILLAEIGKQSQSHVVGVYQGVPAKEFT